VRGRLRLHLTYANVVSTLCLFLVLAGGTAIAASHLARNSVGRRQLQRDAVTGTKVKDHSLTGSDIELNKLGAVPMAGHAATADSAGHAATADSATQAASAAVAASLSATEPTNVVGGPGEPVFQSNSHNLSPPGINVAPVGFYKDHEGVVHLEGLAEFGVGAGGESILFTLPPGYRPAPGTLQVVQLQGGSMLIAGSGSTFEGANVEGEIIGPEEGVVVLSGISFRAGS
jgi:hypothetical protein